MRRILPLILAVLLVAGCPGLLPRMASVLPDGGVASEAGDPGGVPRATPSLAGRIGTQKGYHAQLTDLLNDFARGATVSLIEVTSGETRGTSLVDEQGQFVIEFGGTFVAARPAPDSVRSVGYYLEAVKGVGGASAPPNQAGHDAVRLRTLVWFDFDQGAWISLANSVAGSLTISLSTTTVSFFVNQKVVNQEAVTPEAFIGSVDPQLSSQAPADYTPVASSVPRFTATCWLRWQTPSRRTRIPFTRSF